jgi:hypothetical protein
VNVLPVFSQPKNSRNKRVVATNQSSAYEISMVGINRILGQRDIIGTRRSSNHKSRQLDPVRGSCSR